MQTITARAERLLGKRATEYVHAHGFEPRGCRALLVPARHDISAGVERTLTRVLGRPETIDRGEIQYWRVNADQLVEVSP